MPKEPLDIDFDKYSVTADYEVAADFLRHSYVVNLQEDVERLVGAQEQFDKYGFVFTRWPAVDGHSFLEYNIKKHPREHPEYDRYEANSISVHGTLGCRMSHIGLIRMARLRGLPWVCVFEDDVMFSDDVIFLIARMLETLPDDWDMLQLGGAFWRPKKKSFNEWLVKVRGGAQSTHAYVARASIYTALLKAWEPWYISIDEAWSSVQAESEWYASKYWVAYQRQNMSAIRGYSRKPSISRKWWIYDKW